MVKSKLDTFDELMVFTLLMPHVPFNFYFLTWILNLKLFDPRTLMVEYENNYNS